MGHHLTPRPILVKLVVSLQNQVMKTVTIALKGSYRYVDCGYCENGAPDFRLQEKDEYTRKWRDIYLFDNQMQMLIAIEDFDYTLLLAGKPCYQKDVVKNHYA